jgi:flavin-dependent dehydrogenase
LEAKLMLEATLSWHDVEAAPWDAVIVGAGPAGAVAALWLARDGQRVLLVERKAFPRSKVCGGCLSASGVELLAQIGLAEALVAAGAQPLSRLALHSNRRKVELPLPPGISLSRSTLDGLLVSAAIESGAQFLPATTAEVVFDSRYCARLHGDCAETAMVEPGVILAADGLGHPSLRSVDIFQERVSSTARLGAGTLLEAAPDWLKAQQIGMVIGRSGYVGLVSVEKDRAAVAAALDPAFVRQSGSLDRACAAILAEAQLPLPPLWHEAHWVGTPALSRRTLPLADRNLFLIGDAGGYVEPFTGEGMTWAMRSAVDVVPFVKQALAGENVACDWSERGVRHFAQQSRWCRTLSQSLRSPWLVTASLGALSLAPQLAAPVIRRIAARRS